MTDATKGNRDENADENELQGGGAAAGPGLPGDPGTVFDRIAADAKAIGANATAAEIARLAEAHEMGAPELQAVAATMSHLATEKRERAVQIHLNMSHIPQKSPKTFDSFDFGRIQGKGSAALAQLPMLSNLYARRNLALIGPEGVGNYGGIRIMLRNGLPPLVTAMRQPHPFA